MSKFVDGWFWPDHERHLIEWMAEAKNRMVLNGRSAYQGKKQQLLLSHCPADRRHTFIDVGAHCALWSWNFAHWFDHIEAFEPVPEHRECFEKNTLTMAEKIVLHPFALGDRPGRVAIRVDPLSTGGSFVQGKGDVEMRTLDSFAFENVDCVKLDCEGYEEFVLHGGEDVLRKWKPVICVEQKRDFPVKFGLKPLGAVKFLVGLGYRVVGEISGDYILKVPG